MDYWTNTAPQGRRRHWHSAEEDEEIRGWGFNIMFHVTRDSYATLWLYESLMFEYHVYVGYWCFRFEFVISIFCPHVLDIPYARRRLPQASHMGIWWSNLSAGRLSRALRSQQFNMHVSYVSIHVIDSKSVYLQASGNAAMHTIWTRHFSYILFSLNWSVP